MWEPQRRMLTHIYPMKLFFYTFFMPIWFFDINTNLQRVREKEMFIVEAKDSALSIPLAGNKAWNSIIMLPGNLENIALIKQKLSAVNSQWTTKQHHLILHSIIKAWTADTSGQSTIRKQRQMCQYYQKAAEGQGNALEQDKKSWASLITLGDSIFFYLQKEKVELMNSDTSWFKRKSKSGEHSGSHLF